MSTRLRQSTAVDIALGPFVDDTDGKTAETALSITQPDIRLKKGGGNWAQKSAAQTVPHEENGWYEPSLSTTDTGTLGILIVACHKAGALPVWREFEVVPAEVYDSMVLGADGEPPQGAPPVSASFITKLNYVYKFLRNRVTQDATTMKVYGDDATTVHHKATVGDATGTFDRGEVVSGP